MFPRRLQHPDCLARKATSCWHRSLRVSWLGLSLLRAVAGDDPSPPLPSGEPAPAAGPAALVTDGADVGAASAGGSHRVLDTGRLPYATAGLVRSEAEDVQAREQAEALARLQRHLEAGRGLRRAKLYAEAEPHFRALLVAGAPESLQREAFVELAATAQEQNELPRALQILAQYITLWPQDPMVPEMILRQGLLYRQLGAYEMALTKFYATMTTALVLKGEQFDFYRTLVLQSQAEIAETLALQNRHAEASRAFGRLLQGDAPALNRTRVQFLYLTSLQAEGKHAEVAAQAQDFLAKHADAAEQAQVRFILATAFKKLGRNAEALREVLHLLQAQQAQAKDHPETLAYWQQRTGNEIANQLYAEGDFLPSLAIYSSLLELSPALNWRLPVLYQIGLTCERLNQPSRALDAFSQIATCEAELATNAAPELRMLVDMARWRHGYIVWRGQAEATERALRLGLPLEPAASPAPPTPAAAQPTRPP